LKILSKIDVIYVPGHNESKNVKRRIVKDINTIDYPTNPIVPFIEIIHDRAAIEIMRGCPRRCGFCQAGNTTKPVRLMKPERIKELARETIKNTGFEEISFVSLSSSDYPGLAPIAVELGKEFAAKRISLALPSMRSDSFSKELSDEIQNVRKGGVTLAPEAGTQRLRDLILKDLNEESIISSAKAAFVGGAKSLKLYFMIGLPTETDEDLQGIVALAHKILEEVRACGRMPQRVKLTVNISTFVPKKNTPFGNEKMISYEEIMRKQEYLKQNLKHKSIELKWHDAHMSVIEGLLSQGDSKTGSILLSAFRSGCRFDNWTEFLDWKKWEAAIAQDQDKI
ncbi:MAG: radical SAM protein, partial [Candidatus Margulisiibacteriota bacterium]